MFSFPLGQDNWGTKLAASIPDYSWPDQVVLDKGQESTRLYQDIVGIVIIIFKALLRVVIPIRGKPADNSNYVCSIYYID